MRRSEKVHRIIQRRAYGLRDEDYLRLKVVADAEYGGAGGAAVILKPSSQLRIVDSLK